MLIPVLLSGGVGSRLWPVSRELYPKQFLPLADAKLSLFQQTLERLGGMPALGEPVVVCNEEHRFLVAQQLRDMGHGGASIILEPIGRNTAPAIALAAIDALRQTEDAVLLVLPADHVIRDHAALQRAAQTGMALANAGHLVTFGIVPNVPETGYGYIRRGAALGEQVYAVQPLRGKARPRDRQRLRRERRVFLEQRHVPVPRRPLPRRARQARAADAGRLPQGLRAGQRRPRLHPRAQGIVRRLPQRFHRLRRDGAHRPRRDGAARLRLERRGLLGGAVADRHAGRARQREPRRRDPAQRVERLRARRIAAGCGGGAGGRGDRGNRRRGAGRQQGFLAGREAHRRAPQARGARRSDHRTSASTVRGAPTRAWSNPTASRSSASS